jgi:hypothetical protein
LFQTPNNPLIIISTVVDSHIVSIRAVNSQVRVPGKEQTNEERGRRREREGEGGEGDLCGVRSVGGWGWG